MTMVVDKFDSHIDILTTLQYLAVKKNILLPDILYVVFLHWDENQVYYKIGVYRLYGALHWDLLQSAVDSFLKHDYMIVL